VTKVDENASFARFVYPFLFDAETFDDRMEATRRAHWEGRNRRFEVWRQEPFDEFDLLPQARNYLNRGTPPTATLWELGHDALDSPAGLGARADWKLTLLRGGGKEIPFYLRAFHLMLFSIGVGFLTVHARPKSAEADDWLDFLHYFRLAWRAREVRVKVQRRTGKDQVDPYFPQPAGGLERHADGEGPFGEIVEALLREVALRRERTEASDGKRWWEEVFVPNQLLPYAAVYVDGVSEEGDPEQETVELLYRMRSFFHSGQKIRPTPEDGRFYDHPALLPYAEGMWFVFSLDGGAFVACDAPRDDFWRVTLPDHLKHVYFLLFLLVLHQRYTLTMLEEGVARHWIVGEERQAKEERVAAFERIRDTLLSFTARGYFSQVMQQEHHHRIYRKWQDTLQVQRLYEEVRDEVQEMYQYVLVRRTERLQWRLNQIGLLVGWPVLVLTFLIAIGPTFDWLVVSVVLVVSLVLGMLVLWMISHQAGGGEG
jgi:hypothetical protein